MKQEQVACALTGQLYPRAELVPLASVQRTLANFICQRHPALPPDALISHPALQDYRRRYLEQLLREENQAVNSLSEDVIAAVASQRLLAENVEAPGATPLTLGQRLADRIASFGGSWTFILVFFSFLAAWMALNVVERRAAFDPYPFILLNLILSCLAAIQAPVIMMSQNRKEEKDRRRSENDYKVNLKAEVEIQLLHEKLDHLMRVQLQKLLELQQLQLDYFDAAARPRQNGHGKAAPGTQT